MIPERVTQLLTAYVDGELSSRQRKQVSKMLRKSSEARQLLQKMKNDSLVLRGLPKRKPRLDLTATVLDTIAATNLKIPIRPEAIPLPPGPPPLPVKTIPAWVVFAAAAMILVLVGLGSYFYFAARGGEPGPGPFVENDPALSVPADPQSDEPRPLDPNNVFAYPNLKIPSFRTAQTRVPLILSLADADQACFAHELQQELQKDSAYRLDLFCGHTGNGLERIKDRLAAHGVQLHIEGSATALGECKASLAVYAENLTAAELTKVLQQLGQDDREKLFSQVVVNPMSSWRGPLAGVDIHEEIADRTAQQVLQAPPRPGTEVKKPDRVAVAVPYNPEQVAPSAEVRGVLYRNRQWRRGTVQVLLVLWSHTDKE